MNATFTIDMELPVQWEHFFLMEHNNNNNAHNLWTTFPNLNNRTTTTERSLPEQLHHHHRNVTVHSYAWDKVVKSLSWYNEANIEMELFGNDTNIDTVILSGLTFRMEHYKQNPYSHSFWNRYKLRDLHRAELSYLFFQLYLSTPSPYLQQVIHPYIERLNNKFIIGMQLRLGGVGGMGKSLQPSIGSSIQGVWVDPLRHGPECVSCFVQQAKQMCHSKECVIWVTSDSEDAVQMVQAAFANETSNIQVMYSTGPLTHLDKSFSMKGKALEMNTRTYVDWYIMAKYSDAFLLSRSGFGEHASWYALLDDKTFKPAYQYNAPCEFQDFRRIQDRTSDNEY